MGNANYRQTTGNQYIAQDLRNYFQNDLPKFILQSKIGNGKFMKTYIMRVDSSPLIVKVYMKLTEEDLLVPTANLTIVWKTLSPAKYPQLLPYQMWMKSGIRAKPSSASPVYLIRQFFSTNLYDRLSTRPFLNEMEKLWIVYQLLKCLEICHEHGIVHGDIKPENVMCTSSGWVVLTDFSPFKPALVPDNDPTDFQYYFNCMGRHRCYLAPERFYHRSVSGTTSQPLPDLRYQYAYTQRQQQQQHLSSGGAAAQNKKFQHAGSAVASVLASPPAGNQFPSNSLTPAMDIFSAGCLMAEVFLDGVPLLDLPEMLRYVNAASDVGTLDHKKSVATRSLLQRIPNVHVRNVIIDMTQKDPSKRLSATEYLRLLQQPVHHDVLPAAAAAKSTATSPASSSSSSSSPAVVVEQGGTKSTASAAAAGGGGGGGGGSSLLRAFRPYFDTQLYPLFLRLHWNGVSPDERVNILCQQYNDIIRSITGEEDAEGHAFFAVASPSAALTLLAKSLSPMPSSANATGAGATAAAGGSVIASPTASQKFRNAAMGNLVSANDAQHVLLLPADPALIAATSTSTTSNGMNTSIPIPTSSRNASNADADSMPNLLQSKEQFLKSDSLLKARLRRPFAGAHQGEDEAKSISSSTENQQQSQVFAKTSYTRSSGNHNLNSSDIEDDGSIGFRDMDMDELLQKATDLIGRVESEVSAQAASAPPASASTSNNLNKNKNKTEKRQEHGLGLLNDSLQLMQHIGGGERQLATAVATAASGSSSRHTMNTLDVAGEENILRNAISSSAAMRSKRTICEGIVILVNVIYANFRHLKYPQSKIVSLMILVRSGRFCQDTVLLQRVVPLLLVAMEDTWAPVRAMAVRSLRAVLVQVQTVSHNLESNIFPLYLFPPLTRIAKDVEPAVRIAFAESIGSFAETAKRFLDLTHLTALNKALQQQQQQPSAASTPSATTAATVDPTPSASTSLQFPYDKKLDALKEQVSRWIRDLMVDTAVANSSSSGSGSAGSNSSTGGGSGAGLGATSSAAVESSSRRSSTVKRILLADIMRLCAFFGHESTMDKLLTQLLTFLNDQDWELRHAFCAKIPAVCAFLGPTVTAECILPCVENALYDAEEKVVLRALHSLTSLVQMELLSQFFLIDFVEKVKCLLLHPSASLRQAAIRYLVMVNSSLGHIDATVFLLPLIRDTLRYDLTGLQVSDALLRHAIHPAVSRSGYRTALLSRLSKLQSIYQQQDSSPSQHQQQFASSVTAADVYSSAIASLVQEEAGDDVFKLEIMNSYLDLAAREINTKTLQWRNSGITGLSSSGGAIKTTVGTSRNALLNGAVSRTGTNVFSNAMLDYSTVQWVPEYAVQSLLVPHQKYGLFLYRPLTDDIRKQHVYLDSFSNQKNLDRLRQLYGAAMRQGNQWDATLSSSSAGAESGGAAAGDDATTSNMPRSSLLPVAMSDSLNLVRRVRALKIPALPPDTGYLIQPTFDNRIYSSYMDVLDTSCSLDTLTAVAAGGAVVSGVAAAAGAGATSSVAGSGVAGAGAGGVNPGGAGGGATTSSTYWAAAAASAASAWRPKEGVLLGTLREHSGAVTRLAVSPDQQFFASASADTTVKVWPTRKLDSAAVLRSAVTYRQHRGEVVDMCAIENSHSFASASSDGTVHVWRVDMIGGGGGAAQEQESSSSSSSSSNHYPTSAMVAGGGDSHSGGGGGGGAGAGGPTAAAGGEASTAAAAAGASMAAAVAAAAAGGDGGFYEDYSTYAGRATVSGCSQVRVVAPEEGPVVCVNHFNSDICSMVTYATQRGGLHCWDLRAAREAMHLPQRPELGFTTSMTLSPDRNWICMGTSKGFVSLFDIRYQVPCKLWRHSSGSTIHRLACCKTPRGAMGLGTSSSSGGGGGGASASTAAATGMVPVQSEGAFLFVAAGSNEAAVWGIPEGGQCCKCFRAMPLDLSRGPVAPLPALRDIKIPSSRLAPIPYRDTMSTAAAAAGINTFAPYAVQQQQHSVRAIIGRISVSNMSYLITAGTDASIRFWDFATPSRCFTVSGLEAAQPKAIFDAPKLAATAATAATSNSNSHGNSSTSNISATTAATGTFNGSNMYSRNSNSSNSSSSSSSSSIASGTGAAGKLFVCYVASTPSADKILQAHLPMREGRGIAPPSVNTKDAILDLKNLDLPLRLLISGSRDGEIKLWK